MNPADTIRSGSCAAVASVIAASHASRSGWSRQSYGVTRHRRRRGDVDGRGSRGPPDRDHPRGVIADRWRPAATEQRTGADASTTTRAGALGGTRSGCCTPEQPNRRGRAHVRGRAWRAVVVGNEVFLWVVEDVQVARRRSRSASASASARRPASAPVALGLSAPIVDVGLGLGLASVSVSDSSSGSGSASRLRVRLGVARRRVRRAAWAPARRAIPPDIATVSAADAGEPQEDRGSEGRLVDADVAEVAQPPTPGVTEQRHRQRRDGRRRRRACQRGQQRQRVPRALLTRPRHPTPRQRSAAPPRSGPAAESAPRPAPAAPGCRRRTR